jgi:4-aminobutyrate aminotransferase/(S)-3-amino-2-methylpropionate transaminase
MIGIEFITDEKRTPNPDAAERIISQALDSGLLLLACGTYGNVVRLLPPLNLSDAELSEGIDKLITAIEAVLAPATALA